MPHSFQLRTSSSDISSSDDMLLDTTNDSWRTSPVQNVEAPTIPAPVSSSTAPVTQSTPKFNFGMTDVWLRDNPNHFTKVAPPAATAPSAAATAPVSPSPPGNFQLRRPKLRSQDRSKLGLHKGLKLPSLGTHLYGLQKRQCGSALLAMPDPLP